jgi:hypothetical protein
MPDEMPIQSGKSASSATGFSFCTLLPAKIPPLRRISFALHPPETLGTRN